MTMMTTSNKTVHDEVHDEMNITKRLTYGGIGALAGLLAGLTYGFLLSSQQISPMMGDTSAPGDTFLNLMISVVIGSSFGLLLVEQAKTAGKSLVWGIVLSVSWWLIGPMTLFPLINGVSPQWDVATAREAFPLLVGLAVAYGAFLGLLYWALCSVIENWGNLRVARQIITQMGQAAIAGGLAGLLGGWAFSTWMEQAGFFPLVAGLVNSTDLMTGQGLHFLISVIIGVTYGVLFVQDTRTVGASVAWGMVYGFLWWVLGPLTLMPLILGDGVQWGLAAARDAFPSLIGHLVYGIVLGIFQAGLLQLWRLLFVESDPLTRQAEGPGTRNLRALGLGGAAALGGGLVFSIVMIATESLPTVAELAGGTSPIVGFLVHMFVSVLIGAAYGVLFRHELTSLHTALGWGVVYGAVWWILGPLTLMPLLLGLELQWSLEAATVNFPSLIGHLLYGVVLALVFHRLVQTYQPRRVQRDATQLSSRDRDDELTVAARSAAPALWMLVVLFMLFIILILG